MTKKTNKRSVKDRLPHLNKNGNTAVKPPRVTEPVRDRTPATIADFNAKLLQSVRIEVISLKNDALKKDQLLVERAKLNASLEEQILQLRTSLLHHEAVGVDLANANLKKALGLRDQPLHKDKVTGSVYYLESETPRKKVVDDVLPPPTPDDSQATEPAQGEQELQTEAAKN